MEEATALETNKRGGQPTTGKDNTPMPKTLLPAAQMEQCHRPPRLRERAGNQLLLT
jgi:hypothetical protein